MPEPKYPSNRVIVFTGILHFNVELSTLCPFFLQGFFFNFNYNMRYLCSGSSKAISIFYNMNDNTLLMSHGECVPY